MVIDLLDDYDGLPVGVYDALEKEGERGEKRGEKRGKKEGENWNESSPSKGRQKDWSEVDLVNYRPMSSLATLPPHICREFYMNSFFFRRVDL